MSSTCAPDSAEQFRCTIDHLRVSGKPWDRGHEPGELDDSNDLVEVVKNRSNGGDCIQGGNGRALTCGVKIDKRRIDDPSVNDTVLRIPTDQARCVKLSLNKGQLTRGEDEIPGS